MSPPFQPDAYPYPPWVSALLAPWPLYVIGTWAFLLWMSGILGKDWRIIAPSQFRDEGCDERREAHYWRREQHIAFTLSFLGLNVLLLLFLYIEIR